MTEEEKKAAEAKAKEELEAQKKSLEGKSADELIDIIRQTRSEAKDRRLKERELEEELQKMKDAQKAKEEAKLKEDGKLKELIEAKEKELSNFQSEVTTYKTKAEEFEQFKQSKIDDAKKKLGDKWDEDYSKLSLTALDKLVNSLTLEGKNINVDKGSKGDEVKIELTEEQKKTARAMYPYYAVEKAYEYYTDNLIKTGKIKKEK